MSSAAKPTFETLPDPTGSYLTIIFPQHPRVTSPPDWLALAEYWVAMALSLSNGACVVDCAGQNVTVNYGPSHGNPNEGEFSVTLTINNSSCTFDLVVIAPPGLGTVVQGTVAISSNGFTNPYEVRLLKTPVAFPVGTYTLNSVHNPALDGTLHLTDSVCTYTPTGQASQSITPEWNSEGTPGEPMLTFEATVGEPMVFDALFAPKWNGTHLNLVFRGITGATGGAGGDDDWTATATVPIPDSGQV